MNTHATVRLLAGGALAIGAAAMLALFACEAKPKETKSCDDQALVVDTSVMAFLSGARALHHEANLKEDAGDVVGALAALRRLTSQNKPHPEALVPEVEEVLSDAFARIAELELGLGHFAEAKVAVQQGLSHADGRTYFRGHLLEVSGLIEEARSKALADAGKTGEAEAARKEALRLLEEAITVQEHVIGTALLDGGADR